MRPNRTKMICIRLSVEEQKMLTAKARQAGLSVSSLLRDNVQRVRIHNHRGQQRWFAVLLSLRKHLTALVAKSETFQPADATIAIAYLAAIARHLDQLAKKETLDAN